LCVLIAASSIYAFSVAGGVIPGSELVSYCAGYAPPYFAMLWVAEDARRTRYWPAYHYGLFLFVFWFIALPHYLIHTRGRAGIGRTAGFVLLMLAPSAAGIAGWWLCDSRSGLR
jgi:hypothetical protein